MKLWRLLLPAALAALTACSAAPAAAPAPVHLAGSLHFKGFAPFVYLVLREDSGHEWQLSGLRQEDVQALASTRVELEGRPRERRNQDVATRLPVFEVISLQPARR